MSSVWYWNPPFERLFAFHLISYSSNRAHCSFVDACAFSFSCAVFSGKIKSCFSKTTTGNSCCYKCFCHLQSSCISYGYNDCQLPQSVTGKMILDVSWGSCSRSFLLNVSWFFFVVCFVLFKDHLSCPGLHPMSGPVFVVSSKAQCCWFLGNKEAFVKGWSLFLCARQELGILHVWFELKWAPNPAWVMFVACKDCFVLLFCSS